MLELGYDPKSIEALVSGAIYLTIVTVVVAIPTGVIARRKGRSVTGWVIFALTDRKIYPSLAALRCTKRSFSRSPVAV